MIGKVKNDTTEPKIKQEVKDTIEGMKNAYQKAYYAQMKKYSQSPRKIHKVEGSVNEIKKGRKLSAEEVYGGNTWNIGQEIDDKKRRNGRWESIPVKFFNR